MSEGISAPFIRYPIGTSLMMAGILFVGLVAYPLLPVAPLPQVDFPTIQVTTQLPGADPVTTGLETAPLVILFIASIFLLKFADRRAARRDAAGLTGTDVDGLAGT